MVSQQQCQELLNIFRKLQDDLRKDIKKTQQKETTLPRITDGELSRIKISNDPGRMYSPSYHSALDSKNQHDAISDFMYK